MNKIIVSLVLVLSSFSTAVMAEEEAPVVEIEEPSITDLEEEPVAEAPIERVVTVIRTPGKALTTKALMDITVGFLRFCVDVSDEAQEHKSQTVGCHGFVSGVLAAENFCFQSKFSEDPEFTYYRIDEVIFAVVDAVSKTRAKPEDSATKWIQKVVRTNPLFRCADGE